MRKTVWEDHNGDFPVVLYRIENWGDVWPGKRLINTMPEGKGIEEFDAAEIVWSFFRQYRRTL